MPSYTTKDTRTLKLQKAERPKIGNGIPPSNDGFEGENRIQMVNGKPRLYYRTNNSWYFTGLSQDGTVPNVPIASSTQLGIIKIGSGGTVSSDGTYTATAATPAADDITGGDAAVTISTSSGNITIDAAANNSNIIFKGTDATSDITMLTLSGADAGAATFNNKIVATELDISGNVDIDGTLEADAITVNGSALNTVIAGITVTNATTAAVATTVTITDNEDTDEDNAIIFTAGGDVDGGNLGLESDGHLIYNPSTGALTAHQLKIDSSSSSRIYVANAAGGTTPSVGTSGQAIISYGSGGAPYWGNPIATSNGSEGRIQLSSSSSLITSSSSFGFGALDASPLVLTYTGNMNITGAFEVKNGSTSAGYINFYEDSNNGTNKVTLIGPASTADITLTLPSAAGTIARTSEIIDWTADQGSTNIHSGNYTDTDTVDMGDGFKLADADSNVDVTEGEYVKFTTQQGSAGVGVVTGAGTSGDPHLVTLNYADNNTTYSGGTGLTLSSTTFNVDASQTQINAVGTIGTGVWQGSSIATSYTAAKCTDANADQTSANNCARGATLTDEAIQDLVGAMVSGNTETNCTVTYQDGDGTIDFVTQDTNTTYTAGSGLNLETTEFIVDVSDFMANGSNNRILTAITADTINAEANLTFDGTDLAIAATGKIYLDGGSNTYIQEVAGDDIDIVTAGSAAIEIRGNVTEFQGTIRGVADIVAYYSSDPSLKENKKLISNPLDKIDSIGGYSFDWKEDAIKKVGDDYKHLVGKDYGVMADEIQSIFPELVDTRSNGIRAVKYDKLVPLLIEGIKELKHELDIIKGVS